MLKWIRFLKDIIINGFKISISIGSDDEGIVNKSTRFPLWILQKWFEATYLFIQD